MSMLDKLTSYNLEFKYISGKYNSVADGLTRFPVDIQEEVEEEKVATVNVRRVFLGRDGEEIIPKDIEDLAAKGKEDKDYQELIRFFEGDRNWEEASGDVLAYKNLKDEISIEQMGEGKMLILRVRFLSSEDQQSS